MEDHLVAINVVAKPEAAKGEPPLPIAKLDGLELSNVVFPAAVVGIGREDLDRSVLEGVKLRVAFAEGSGESLEVGSGADRKKVAASCLTTPPGLPLRLLTEFLEEFLGRPTLAGKVLLIALADMFADLGVLKFQVILELVDIHQAGNGDTVFFKDEVLLVQMNPLNHSAEVNAGLSKGETLDHGGNL